MFALPFTQQEFLEVFRTYNQAIWPAQVLAYLFGAIAVGMGVQPNRFSGSTILGILAAFWVWTGSVYHITFFSSINGAAYLFGALFILEGILLSGVLFRHNDLDFSFKFNSHGITGALLIAYAMIIYPLIGYALGHGYPMAPMFGVAPCPMVIFTFGILLWSGPKLHGWLLVIPGLWSVIGLSAALRLGIPEDTGLFVAGVVAIGLWFYKNRSHDTSNRRTGANAA